LLLIKEGGLWFIATSSSLHPLLRLLAVVSLKIEDIVTLYPRLQCTAAFRGAATPSRISVVGQFVILKWEATNPLFIFMPTAKRKMLASPHLTLNEHISRHTFVAAQKSKEITKWRSPLCAVCDSKAARYTGYIHDHRY